MMKRYDFSNLNILVVDDCRFMSQVLERILEILGVGQTRPAKDGSDAIQKLQEFNADILIVDWEMAPMSGPEFIHYLRTDPNSPDPYLPVIMLSAYSESLKVEQARDFGITEFLAKPVSAKTLYSRLVSVVEQPRAYVQTGEFFGPCRRRLNLPAPEGERRVSRDVEQSAFSPQVF